MRVSEGLRDIRAWPRARLGIGLVVAIAFILALAAVSGLAPFGTTAGAGWRSPLLVLVGTSVGLYAASAVRAPIGAEMTLCDLRWPGLATIATASAGRDATLATGFAVLFDVAALALMVWAVAHRLEEERRALGGGDGAACLTCRPVFLPRSRRGWPRDGPEIRPLEPAPVRLERPLPDHGDRAS
ncbi:MAG: hypothetical protein HIU86_13885 [Acidobacteria bacterium]|nr:hypothetical protein [Acidobacteriota bacterium]